MKLFSPKNNWDMKSPSSWWPLVGSIQTSSGIAINEESALALTAFSCGVRVISETISSLPCHLLERKDSRTWGKATEHNLYRIVHDQPNREQDSMQFLDSQISLQVGWGNAYAEVERSGGEVVAVWPIHPSRIPLPNIRRNGAKLGEIYAGEPGELVYYINNDDGSETPIPASSMLHVAGALSRNGITGRGLVKLGANALGIAQATEEHAGAFFKNGANPNIAIKSPKIVGKETADRLRNQWQTVFGGVKNHYKTILLEDGMDAIPFTLSPQVSQMIEQRKFSVEEVSRLTRLPPYFLMDLSQGKYNNLEAQGQDLVIYSLMPWIVRWEKAMQRQLLTDAEKKKYKFKFNVMGLLRGDQAARAAFYQAGFNMGVFSPNDIREYEDLNPVEGGDQRFVPANNLVPLDKIGEMAQATIDKTQAEIEGMKPVAPAVTQSVDSTATVEAGAADVQAMALNGAQITALVQIATMLATDQFPPEATRAMLKAAFPSMSESLIDDIVKDLAAFDPPQPVEPVPAPSQPPADDVSPAQSPSTKPEEDKTAENLAKIAEMQAKLLVLIECRGQEDQKQDVEREIKSALEKMPADIAGAMQDRLAMFVDMQTAAIDENRQEREASESRIAELTARSQVAIVETLNAAKEYVETLPPAMEKVFSPLVESINTQNQANSEQSKAILAAVEAIEIPQPVEPPPVDTSAAEALAVRESELAKRQAELDSRLTVEREASHGVLCAAIQLIVEDLADWESKSAASWVETPNTFQKLRTEFYQRFVKRFGSRLEQLSLQAEQVGVLLDVSGAADRYAIASINDLKTLDEFAADNWHDRLREGVDSLRKNLWTGRAASLAAEMVEQGKQRFKESNHA